MSKIYQYEEITLKKQNPNHNSVVIIRYSFRKIEPFAKNQPPYILNCQGAIFFKVKN